MNNVKIAKIIDEHISAAESMKDEIGILEDIIQMLWLSLIQGGKIMLIGNGGSAADCQHIAAEFTGRFVNDRVPLAAIALTTDTSALTCIANDYNFESIFSRQVLAIGKPDDCLICISTSGNSKNLIKAALDARQIKVKVIGLLGSSGGELKNVCDKYLVVNSRITARIQELHILVGHIICAEIERKMFH